MRGSKVFVLIALLLFIQAPNALSGAIESYSIQSCSDGNEVTIDQVLYRNHILVLSGSAVEGATITIIDADANIILADGINTLGNQGAWRIRIKNLEAAPEWIMIKTSTGCSRMFNRILFEQFNFTETVSY